MKRKLTHIHRYVMITCLVLGLETIRMMGAEPLLLELKGSWPNYQRHGGDEDNGPGYADAVVRDNYVFIAGKTAGLRIVDISKPELPITISNFPTKGPALAVALKDHYAFVAESDLHETDSIAGIAGGLYVVDVSDPTHPVQVGFFEQHAYPKQMTINFFKQTAVVSGLGPSLRRRNLKFIDVSDPSEPSLVAEYDADTFMGMIPSSTLALFKRGNIASVVDLTELSDIREVATWEIEGDLRSVKVQDHLVFVATNIDAELRENRGLLLVMDLSDPSQPQERRRFHMDTICDMNTTRDPDRIIVRHPDQVRLFQFNLATGITELAGIHMDSGCRDIVVKDKWVLAFHGDSPLGFKIIDFVEFSHPVVVGNYANIGWSWDVSIANDLAYVADGPAGVQMIDFDDPASPIRVGQYQVEGSTNWIHVEDKFGLIFVQSEQDRGQFFASLDLTDPIQPVEISRWTLPLNKGMREAEVSESRLVWAENDRIKMLDLPFSSQSTTVEYPIEGKVMAIEFEGNRLFVAVEKEYNGSFTPFEVLSLDLENPNAIHKQSSLEIEMEDRPGPGISNLFVHGDLAWVEVHHCFIGGCYDFRRITLDLSQPNEIKTTGMVNEGSGFNGIEDVIQIGSMTFLSRRPNIRIEGPIQTSSSVEGGSMAIWDDLLFVTNRDGLQILQISPSILQTMPPPRLALPRSNDLKNWIIPVNGGRPGQTVQIQRSSNLTEWTSFKKIRKSAQTEDLIEIESLDASPQAFFRIQP